MLCLSGFELYSRWVPLNFDIFTQIIFVTDGSIGSIFVGVD